MSAQRAPEHGRGDPLTPLPHASNLPVASGPLLAPSGASAALASRPDEPLDGTHYHIYEGRPAPWWIAAIWVGFFIFAVSYLITNLID